MSGNLLVILLMNSSFVAFGSAVGLQMYIRPGRKILVRKVSDNQTGLKITAKSTQTFSGWTNYCDSRNPFRLKSSTCKIFWPCSHSFARPERPSVIVKLLSVRTRELRRCARVENPMLARDGQTSRFMRSRDCRSRS